MEKVISEFKVVETEDGFRIEIKGNKEALRQMWSGFGRCGSFKAETPSGRGFGFGPEFWSEFASWCGPWQRTEEKGHSI